MSFNGLFCRCPAAHGIQWHQCLEDEVPEQGGVHERSAASLAAWDSAESVLLDTRGSFQLTPVNHIVMPFTRAIGDVLVAHSQEVSALAAQESESCCKRCRHCMR